MKEVKAEATQTEGSDAATVQIALSHKESPIPSVEDLERLYALDPQYVEKTFALVEQESTFRQNRQSSIDLYQHQEQMRRILVAGVVVVCGFIAAVLLAVFEAYTAAGIVGGATLVGLAGAFMGSDKSKQPKKIKAKPKTETEPQ